MSFLGESESTNQSYGELVIKSSYLRRVIQLLRYRSLVRAISARCESSFNHDAAAAPCSLNRVLSFLPLALFARQYSPSYLLLLLSPLFLLRFLRSPLCARAMHVAAVVVSPARVTSHILKTAR